MPSPHDTIAPRIQDAIVAAFGADLRGADPVLRPSQFADLQCNAPLALAKRVGMPPREVATRLVAALDLEGICDRVEISGPGFVNLHLADEWVTDHVREAAADSRLGVSAATPERIVIDYSSPNVAKEMHVGHLRTTVVGDALARTLEFLGHTVIRQNHIGDWGTPFGMLIEHLLDVGEGSAEALAIEDDPNAFYQAARVKFDGDEAFATRARERVVKLQGGDTETLRLWRELVELSKHYFNKIYSLLDITLTDADLAGESSYNDDLPRVCAELEQAGLAVISDGALCVFQDEFVGRDGAALPLIVRKSDGGYGYATTDLAMVRDVVRRLHADRAIYVVGATQALHFRMTWSAARLAGWLPDTTTLTHVQIGNVLGADKKILRTRAGDSLRLMVLVEDAINASLAVLDEARPDLDPATRHTLAQQIGVGAIKYADLSVAHDSEYVFDLERMVSLTGNTGPYLQYAAARVRSIFRSAGLPLDAATPRTITVTEPAERALALALLEFAPTVELVGRELTPHKLCAYLFELAQTFSAFYEHCPVLKAEGDVRESRLALCAATFHALQQGLALLGIATPEQM